MGRTLNKLPPNVVNKKTQSGLYADGGGLYLQITDTGVKSWLFRFTLNGKARAMGLGACHAITLADARGKATECRKLLADNLDPIEVRKDENAKGKLAAAKAMTFEQCAKSYIESHKAGWRNEKHIWQWENTLSRFAYPVLDKLPVQDIDVSLVTKVLEPIWKEKTETASRLRGRIEAILDWATARGYRQGDNPARWRGHIENLLPRPSKVRTVTHHPALPYQEVGDFVAALQKHGGIAANALEFLILTAARTSEVIGASWQEIDLNKGIWTIPANRIKAGRLHRVPLSGRAIAILKTMQDMKSKATDYIFPGLKEGKPLSNTAMLMLLRRMDRDDLTSHGFRSSFRDWCAEQTHYAREVAEAALAHVIGDKTEAAYRRSDLFEKRKQMMEAWARYCMTLQVDGVVIKMKKPRK